MADGKWDGVPWAIGENGAEHSVNVARNLAFAAFGGREGIVSPRDLEVRELAVPGTKVRIYPGTVAILNRAVGTRDEMYVGRLPIQDTVDIAATDALTGRTDLIVARVEDSSIASEGWDTPANVVTGPYIHTRVISNVPPTTTTIEELGLGYSAYPLARITIPPSTGTITQAMITDLRDLARQFAQRELLIGSPTGTQEVTSGSYGIWPTTVQPTVKVPPWATHAKVLLNMGGIGYGQSGGGAANVIGDVKIRLTKDGVNTDSETTAYNFSLSAGFDRGVIIAAGKSMMVPESFRGKTITAQVLARRSSGNTNVSIGVQGIVSFDIEFVTARENNT